jgi:hypothetical protein
MTNNKTCPCGMSFMYQSQLKRHQNSKLGCLFYEIAHFPHISHELTRKGETSENLEQVFLCNICNKKFAKKFNQERHEKICKQYPIIIGLCFILNILIFIIFT